MRYAYLLIFLLLTVMMACENSIEDYQPVPDGRDYFPLEIGHTWIYQVDSIVFDNNGNRIDSSSRIIREEITEQFIDQSGTETYRLVRSEQKGNNWIVSDIWSTSIDNRLAYKTEENLRFAKLSFPVVEGNAWDGNAYIDEEIIIKVAGEPIRAYQNWGLYNYNSVGNSESIGGINYDKICTVNQVDLEDKITRRYSVEKYAENTGLVYKYMMILNTQKFDSTDPWEEKAEEGFILEQYLLEFIPG